MKKYLLATIAGVFIGVILISASIMMVSPSCFSSLQNQLTGFVTADLQRDASPSACETSFNSCTTDCNNWLTTCNQKCDSGSIIEECYSYCSRQDPSCTPKCTTTYDTCFKTERQKRTPLAEITKICTEQKNTCEKECNPRITECRDSCKEKSDSATCKNKCAEKKQNTCDVDCTTKLNQCKSTQPALQTTTTSRETSVATAQTRTPAPAQRTVSQRDRVSSRDAAEGRTEQKAADEQRQPESPVSPETIPVENRSEVVQETLPPPEPQQQPEQTPPRLERTPPQPQTTPQVIPQQPVQPAQPQKQVNLADYTKRIDALVEAMRNGKVTDEAFKKNMERLQKTFPQLDINQIMSMLAEIKTGAKTYDDLKQLLNQIVQNQDVNLSLKPLGQVVDTLKDSLSAQQQRLEKPLKAPDNEPQQEEEKNQLQEPNDNVVEDALNQEADVQEHEVTQDEEDFSEEEDLEQWLEEDITSDVEETPSSDIVDEFVDTEKQSYDEFAEDEGLFDEFTDTFESDEEWDIGTFEEEFNADDYGFEDFSDDQIPDEFSDASTDVIDQEPALEGGEEALPDEEELGLEEDLSLEEALGDTSEEVSEEELLPSEETPAEKPVDEKKQDIVVDDSEDKLVIKRIDGTDVKIIDGSILPAKTGSTLREKTRIVTGEETKTNINYKTNVQVRIDARTELLVKKIEKKNFVETVRLQQDTGTSTYKITKNPDIKPDIETPNAIVRIDGVVEVKYDKDSRTTTVRVFEGKAYVTSLVEKKATPQPLTDKQETIIRGKPNLFMRIANALR